MMNTPLVTSPLRKSQNQFLMCWQISSSSSCILSSFLVFRNTQGYGVPWVYMVYLPLFFVSFLGSSFLGASFLEVPFVGVAVFLTPITTDISIALLFECQAAEVEELNVLVSCSVALNDFEFLLERCRELGNTVLVGIVNNLHEACSFARI